MKQSTYYVLIFLPLILLAVIFLQVVKDSMGFAISILTYCFIYRPLVDGEKLVSNGVLASKDRWKIFIPFFRYRNTKTLYWNWKK